MKSLYQRIRDRIGETEAYFVGGCVRDLLLGTPTKDIDLAVAGDTYALGRSLARDPDSHVFWLRQEDQVVRVLLADPEGGAAWQVDVCPLRGTVDEDLRARDLTINALAIPARDGLERGARILDPTGGQADLSAGVVRFASPSAPERDPLRTLRALRFRWKLDFRIEPDTARRTRECVPLLARVSTERIRDELFQLLAMPRAPEALADCLSFGMLRWLVGAELEVAEERELPAPAARVQAVMEILSEPRPDLLTLLQTEPTPPRARRELLLWAAALQPLLPALDPNAAARYLALSNDERQLITRGLAGAEEAGELVRRWPAPGRAVGRLLRKARPAGPEAVLLAGARGGWSAPHAELLEMALNDHFWPKEPLLTGIEVMQLTGLSPGPEVGRILEQVEDARWDGLLRNGVDAAAWVRERFGR